MPITANTLPKAERLHLKRSIDELFATGRSFVSYPLRVVYLIDEAPLEARGQMMVSVSKRYFRRAHDRNRIKRLVREAYRTNKHLWLTTLAERGLYARVSWMSVARELPDYSQVERAVIKALGRIMLDEGLALSDSSKD